MVEGLVPVVEVLIEDVVEVVEMIGIVDQEVEICLVEEDILLQEEADLNILLLAMIPAQNIILEAQKDIQAGVEEVTIQTAIKDQEILTLQEMTTVHQVIRLVKEFEATHTSDEPTAT